LFLFRNFDENRSGSAGDVVSAHTKGVMIIPGQSMQDRKDFFFL
jgi:hypothetical protein